MKANPTAGSAVSLDLIEDLVREAGEIALSYFRCDPQVWTKGDDSPVCEADLAVDSFLRRTLLANHPGFGWISEESASGPYHSADRPVFVLDPVDGTRAFIRGEPEWAISIGVIENGRPVAGVLFCPMLDELFRAERGGGAERNGEPISVSAPESAHGARAAGPRSILGGKEFFDLSLDLQPGGASLAYRLARVADGRLDAAVARQNSHDWDLAAADLLVHEAGGRLTDAEGGEIRYNRPTLAHPALVCGPERIHADLRERVAAVLR